MRPPPRHASFFSSLRQVEARLKSEEPKPQQHKPEPVGSSPTSSAVHPSSPFHLHCPQAASTSTLHESDPPPEFLSQSIDFPPTPTSFCAAESASVVQTAAASEGDDISRLLGLLGISACGNDGGDDADGSEFSDSGFYLKVAGLKGPKSGKEVKRLDGWIRYMINDGGGEKREPLRLAHLLLGKAAFLNSNGFEGIEFPATVEEFLQNDPPV